VDTREGDLQERGRGSVNGRTGMVAQALVARAEDVAPYLQRFVDETLGGNKLLCLRTPVADKTLKHILDGSAKWVGEELVDDLFARGLGRPDLYREINFVPNPTWSQERWLRWKAGCESD